jgi:hypothetical protein
MMITTKELIEEAVLEALRELRGMAVVNAHLSSEEWDALLIRAAERLRGG